MLGTALGIIKGVAIFAGAMPGMEWILDAVDAGVADATPVNDIVDALQELNHTAAGVSAQIGNAIGLDDYLGVPKDSLTGKDFYEGFGIIDDTAQKTASLIPPLYDAVVQNPLPAAGGALAMLAVASVDTTLPNALHDGGARVGKTVVNIANRASQHAQTAAQTVQSAIPHSAPPPSVSASSTMQTNDTTPKVHGAVSQGRLSESPRRIIGAGAPSPA